MNDCCLITAISGIACAMTKCCSDDELSLLSVAFSQLGDTLATYLTQKEIREKFSGNKNTDQKSETTRSFGNENGNGIKEDQETDIPQNSDNNDK